jgi:hypothetical protein
MKNRRRRFWWEEQSNRFGDVRTVLIMRFSYLIYPVLLFYVVFRILSFPLILIKRVLNISTVVLNKLKYDLLYIHEIPEPVREIVDYQYTKDHFGDRYTSTIYDKLGIIPPNMILTEKDMEFINLDKERIAAYKYSVSGGIWSGPTYFILNKRRYKLDPDGNFYLQPFILYQSNLYFRPLQR